MYLSVCCNRYVLLVSMDLTAVLHVSRQIAVMATIPVNLTLARKCAIQAGRVCLFIDVLCLEYMIA